MGVPRQRAGRGDIVLPRAVFSRFTRHRRSIPYIQRVLKHAAPLEALAPPWKPRNPVGATRRATGASNPGPYRCSTYAPRHVHQDTPRARKIRTKKKGVIAFHTHKIAGTNRRLINGGGMRWPTRGHQYITKITGAEISATLTPNKCVITRALRP